VVAGPRYVIVGSPLTADATTLPVRATFVPWLGSVLTERLVGEPGQVVTAAPGTQLPRPRWADAIEGAEGERTPLPDVVDVPARAGTFFLLRGGRRVGAIVVNPPPEESNLDRFTARELADRLESDRTLVAPTASSWTSMAYRAAARRSLVEPALIAALLMLIIEAIAVGARSRRVA
jgi:hypothetical protein